MARGRNIVESSDEEEFPDIAAVRLKSEKTTTAAATENLLQSQPSPKKKSMADDGKTPTVRRRRLGQITGNALLRPAGREDDSRESSIITPETLKQDEPEEGPRVGLRESKARPAQEVEEICSDEEDDAEEHYEDGDSMRDFIVSDSDFEEEESPSDDDDDLFIGRSPSKTRLVRGDLLKRAPATATLFDDEDEPSRKDKKAAGAKSRGPDKAPSRSTSGNNSRMPSSREGSVLRDEQLPHSRESRWTPSDPDLSGALSRLKMYVLTLQTMATSPGKP
ncbi:MAG: hypothetical protein OK454_08230 [Thaumarchaeota archaeon]|nr:hypothetical protein [Nitrososphaerota archaeon]